MNRAALVCLAATALPVFCSLANAQGCDSVCLLDLADGYMRALPGSDPSGLAWADRVRYTENDVPMMIGDGVWGTATAASAQLLLSDPTTGTVVWFGTVEEHGLPAYYAMRLQATEGRIGEVEAIVSREGTPAHFGPPQDYVLHASFRETVSLAERRSRARLVELANEHYDALQRGEIVHARSRSSCEWISNGVSMNRREGEERSASCENQSELGAYGIDRVRSRRYPIVSEELGVVVALVTFDRAARVARAATLDGRQSESGVAYPSSLTVLELLKIRSGNIERIEGIAVFQPYGMPSVWQPAPFE